MYYLLDLHNFPPKHVSFFLSFVSSSNEFPAGMEGRSRDPDLFMAKQAAINHIFSETKHTFGDTFILLLAGQQEWMFVLILLIIISPDDRNGISAKFYFWQRVFFRHFLSVGSILWKFTELIQSRQVKATTTTNFRPNAPDFQTSYSCGPKSCVILDQLMFYLWTNNCPTCQG